MCLNGGGVCDTLGGKQFEKTRLEIEILKRHMCFPLGSAGSFRPRTDSACHHRQRGRQHSGWKPPPKASIV